MRGFLLVELLVVISIFVFLLSIAFFSFSSLKNSQSIDKNIAEIKALIQEAKSMSVSGKDDSAYGIKILSNKIVVFKAVYSQSSQENIILAFRDISVDTISILGGGDEILFSKNSGIPNTTGSFRIVSLSDATRYATIRINASGSIE